MSEQFVLHAELREDAGKGSSRRLRREMKVPAIVYGGKAGANLRKPQSITLESKELVRALEDEAFYNSIIHLKIDGKEDTVLLKDLQRHPSKQIIWHADFLRVSMTTEVKAHVPVHIINEEACIGVRLQGGQLMRNATTIEVQCMVSDLPELIEVDVEHLEVNQSIHLDEITLPENVTSVALALGEEYNEIVTSVIESRAEEVDVETDEEESEEEVAESDNEEDKEE